MLVSVIMPCYRAEAYVGRAVRCLIQQTYTTWEAIIVSDDQTDYQAALARQGLADPRLRFLTTGQIKSGLPHGRNLGLAAAHGDMIGWLDADDFYLPTRLERLVPLAKKHGAAYDSLRVVNDDDGHLLYCSLPPSSVDGRLRVADIFALNTPMVPVVARQHVRPYPEGIQVAVDVVGNLCLLDALGPLPVITDQLYEYRVVKTSICHHPDAAARFERAYTAYIERLQTGDGFGVRDNRAIALRGFIRKRAVNRLFGQAQATNPELTFQDFVAGAEAAIDAQVAKELAAGA